METNRYTWNHIAATMSVLFAVLAVLNFRIINNNASVIMDNIIYTGDTATIVRFGISTIAAIAFFWFAKIYEEDSEEFKEYKQTKYKHFEG